MTKDERRNKFLMEHPNFEQSKSSFVPSEGNVKWAELERRERSWRRTNKMRLRMKHA